jgi:predicted tellurium resistance membrane protein TerC
MAIRTILVADLIMSLDNVIAVAAAAGGHWVLMIIGLAISIPIVIFGATLLVKVMERWPVIITIGAALIGFVAGEMGWEDAAIEGFTKVSRRDEIRRRSDRRRVLVSWAASWRSQPEGGRGGPHEIGAGHAFRQT